MNSITVTVIELLLFTISVASCTIWGCIGPLRKRSRFNLFTHAGSDCEECQPCEAGRWSPKGSSTRLKQQSQVHISVIL